VLFPRLKAEASGRQTDKLPVPGNSPESESKIQLLILINVLFS
jgi:hypothetical protein